MIGLLEESRWWKSRCVGVLWKLGEIRERGFGSRDIEGGVLSVQDYDDKKRKGKHTWVFNGMIDGKEHGDE